MAFSYIKRQQMTEKFDQTMDSLKSLDNMSKEWLDLIDQFLMEDMKTKFDILQSTVEQNIRQLEVIEDEQQNQIKDIILKSNLKVDNKSANDLTETDLQNQLISLTTIVQSLSSELLAKKQIKTEQSDKTRALMKQLEEMEMKVRELRHQKEANNSNEYQTLASIMRVMYKKWNNSKVVGLLFNDNEEKSLQRLIVIDKENKTEEQLSHQFWESLEKDYKIND